MSQDKTLPQIGSTQKRGLLSLDFIGDIAKAVPQVTGQFNSEFQASQVAIANANARTAEAQAQAGTSTGVLGGGKPPTVYIVIAIVVVIALFMVLKPSK